MSALLEEENALHKNEMAKFLEEMESYTPTVPDDVALFYLNRAGFVCPDVRVRRMIALAAQKFVAEIADTAFQFCKMRSKPASKRSKAQSKMVLTTEDLAHSMKQYGISICKPAYFADDIAAGLARGAGAATASKSRVPAPTKTISKKRKR